MLTNVETIPKFHEVHKLQRFISAKDDVAWRTFILKGFNLWVDKNCEQVPRTANGKTRRGGARSAKVTPIPDDLFEVDDVGLGVTRYEGLVPRISARTSPVLPSRLLHRLPRSPRP